MYAKLEGETRFVKDLRNRSLVNTDVAGLHEYKRRKQMQNQVEVLSGEINNMKNEMAEIKSLLVQLVQKSSAEK